MTATSFDTGNIIVLNAITGSQVATLSRHTNWVKSLAFSSDGMSLASGCDDATVNLWDIQTGGVIKTFYGHGGYVHSISISSDCTTIASGSHDKTIHLWNIQTGECQCIIQPGGHVEYVNFSPSNPQHLISMISKSTSGIIQQWDINGNQIGPEYRGSHFSFSPDGTNFALCEDQAATVQDCDSGAIMARFHKANTKFYCCFSWYHY